MADNLPDLRSTMWIITEVLGSCILLLLILLILLLVHVRRLHVAVNSCTHVTREQHAFQAPDIQPGEELDKRGFAQYGGSTDSFVLQDSPDYSSISKGRAMLYPANKY